MKHSRIRNIFNDYFEDKGHKIVRSAPLIPAKDPTLLFTNAGMNQFKQVFLGEEKRSYNRAVSVQKCMRVSGKHNDFNEVGRTEFHHTFFEMLGNFSFGDYFKEKAIEYSWDMLINHYKFNSEKLWITVYLDDDEAYNIWRDRIGIPESKIVRLGEKDNFWQMGDVGPCGPCSEIHFDKGEEFGVADFEKNENRFVEIWNLVFMQYIKDETGKLNPLPKPSIDTGMGLERLTALLQNKDSNYKTDLFLPIMEYTKDILGREINSENEEISLKVIADHIRALTFLISDGVIPANDGRGYVLKRLLRRAARHGSNLGFKKPFLNKISDKVVELMDGVYPDLSFGKNFISEMILSEEERFSRTLTIGLKKFEEILSETIENGKKEISGKELFKLSDTYGFPIDFAVDLAVEKNISVDMLGYNSEMENQKQRSRKNTVTKMKKVVKFTGIEKIITEFTGYEFLSNEAELLAIYEKNEDNFLKIEQAKGGENREYIFVFNKTPFYPVQGGQIGDTGVGLNDGIHFSIKETVKLDSNIIAHTVEIQRGEIKIGDTVELIVDKKRRKNISVHHSSTHLLHTALREVLGLHIKQSGSLVDENRLRFDFTHYKAVSEDELEEVEKLINEKIRENLIIQTEELPFDDAIERGAIAIFNEKYSDVVRLVSMGEFSKELCGGTHLKRTGEIGLFKIMSESSISSGIRRIEAVGGEKAYLIVNKRLKILDEIQAHFAKKDDNIFDYLKKIEENLKSYKKEIKKTDKSLDIKDLLKNTVLNKGSNYIVEFLEGIERKQLSALADRVAEDIRGVSILFTNLGNKSLAVVSVDEKNTKNISANYIIREISPLFEGRGGGKSNFAQAGGKKIIDFAELKEKIIGVL